MKKINGQTADEWASQLFEFDNCNECHKGKENHDIIEFMGNWFARCKKMTRKEKRLENLMPQVVPKWIRVYDNGGQDKPGGTFDRYTVIYTHAHSFGLKGYTVGVGMSNNPFHPQGFGQHFEYDRYKYNGMSGGKKITYHDLPEDCQRLVKDDYIDYWGLK